MPHGAHSVLVAGWGLESEFSADLPLARGWVGGCLADFRMQTGEWR